MRMLRRVGRILFRVPQLESAVGYYRDVLGMKLLRHEKRLAVFQMGDHQTELVLHTDEDRPAEEMYLLVDDVRGLFERREELELNFVQSPLAGARGYHATVRDPFGTVLQLADHSLEGAHQHLPDEAPSQGLFAGVELQTEPQRERLVRLYELTARTADDLPYTAQFEKLYDDYVEELAEPRPSRAEVWRHLLNLRKAGRLARVGDARSRPPKLDEPERARLRHALGDDAGRRDRLPYTERFNAIVDEFNHGRARPLSPHQVWRAIATIAK